MKFNLDIPIKLRTSCGMLLYWSFCLKHHVPDAVDLLNALNTAVSRMYTYHRKLSSQIFKNTNIIGYTIK